MAHRPLLLLLAAAASWLAAAPARAEPPAAPASALGAKRDAAPDAALAGSLDAPARPAEPRAAPALDFDSFRHVVEGQVSGKRREEMADLEKLVRLGGSDDELPGWLFRLGELHWEEAQYLFFEANRRDDALAKLGAKDPAAARLRAEKADLERRSRAEQEDANRRYREVVSRFPRWRRLDEVLFFLGENLWKQQKRKEALVAYRALLTRHPGSRFVPDAWIAYGEYFFDAAERGDREANLRKALEAYERAGAAPGSDIAGFALYKQAWVHYNLGAWDRALELFARVIAVSDARAGDAATKAGDKSFALAREARKDYVRTYSHAGSPREAPERFAKVAGARAARAMTKGLADLYWESGKDREAILVYHRLVEEDPTAADAALFQARIVTAAGRLGKRDLAVKQAQRFPAILEAAAKAKSADTDEGRRAIEAARADAENTLRTLAVQYHSEWRKTRAPETAQQAEVLYREYVALFPEARNARELRFYHAELLFALERWQEAGDEYTTVAKLGAARGAPSQAPDAKPLKYQTEALESAVLAYAEVAKRAQGGAAPRPAGAAGPAKPPGSAPGHGAMPPAQRQLVEACERYLTFAPRGEKAVAVAYQAAQAYYAHDQLADAERLFTAIAIEHPRDDLARFSANLALDTLNLRRDWRGMNALARRFWGTDELMRAHPELREDLERVVEQSSFKLVEELQRAGRNADAAEAYVAFATELPESKLAPTALHNAAVSLADAHATDRAIAVREQLARRYPANPLAAKALALNAQDWAATADFERAADAWERYHAAWKRQAERARRPAAGSKARATRPAKPAAPADAPAGAGYEEQVARDGLFDAAVIREALGQLRRAEQDRLAFLASWPDAREAPRVFLSLADLAAKEGNGAKEARLLREYQKKYARSPDDWLAAQHRIARGAERRGERGVARKAWAEALAYARGRKVGERGLPAVAQARYLALDDDFAAYDRITFAGGPRRLQSTLALKARKLEALQKAYTEVVNLKVPEPAVCALGRIGAAYRRFSHALLATPVPPEIRRQPALAAEYRKQLAGFAEAPEKKGLEGLEIAVAKARELGVDNACAKEAAAALAKVRPEEPAPPVPRWEDEPAPADPEAAWREARAALLRNPADRGALVAAMRAALARRAWGVARLVALRAEKVAPGDPEVALLRARASEGEGDRAAARADLLAAAGKGNVAARRALLSASLAARDWTGAAEHARALEKLDPKDPRVVEARRLAEARLARGGTPSGGVQPIPSAPAPAPSATPASDVRASAAPEESPATAAHAEARAGGTAPAPSPLPSR